MTEFEASAAGKHLAPCIRQHLHLLGNLEFCSVELLSLDTLTQ